MEKYDKKFYDYLVLNQHNYNDLAVNNDSIFSNNSNFKKLQLTNAKDKDSINKRSNNLIWMFFYFFILIILILMIFLFI